MISLETRREICQLDGGRKLVGSECEDRAPLWKPAGGCRVHIQQASPCRVPVGQVVHELAWGERGEEP